MIQKGGDPFCLVDLPKLNIIILFICKLLLRILISLPFFLEACILEMCLKIYVFPIYYSINANFLISMLFLNECLNKLLRDN